MEKVPKSMMIGPYGPTAGGRTARLTEECQRNLMTLSQSEVLLIPEDPTQPSSGRGYLHDIQMLVHSFSRRKNLQKFSTWKTEHPETGEKVLAVAIRRTKK
jgi:hypothetical protein